MSQYRNAAQTANGGRGPLRLLLSAGLPALLAVAYLVQQGLVLAAQDSGLGHGFAHPLTGWDHLLTMLGVGVWAAQLRGRAIWLLPLSFVGVMSLGGLAGASGVRLPAADGIILLSCAVFTLLITRNIRFSTRINVLIVAFFAFFHGFAHGQEISASASLLSYTLGFMLATLLLHGAGILVARLLVLLAGGLLGLMAAQSAWAGMPAAAADGDYRAVSLAGPYLDLSAAADTAGPADDGGLESWRRMPPAVYADIADAAGHGHAGAGPFKAWHAAAAGCGSASGPWPCGRHAEDGRLLALTAFREFYPDVNHSPGKGTLSTGVGRTSPPLWFAAFADFPRFPDPSLPASAAIRSSFLAYAPPGDPAPGPRLPVAVRRSTDVLTDAFRTRRTANAGLAMRNPAARAFAVKPPKPGYFEIHL